MAVEERNEGLEEALDVEEMSADDINGSFVPLIRPEVTGVEVDGEAVLLIEGAWSIHWLNQISTVVFSEFDGTASVDEVADRLSRAFQADPEVVRSDVLELTRQLGKGGFLVGVAIEEVQYNRPSVEGVPVGTTVPPFQLTDLTGRTVSLQDFHGQQTVLVNWSPHCGFCSKIAPELAELQPELRARGVETVLISIGTAEELQEQVAEFGLEIPVLLQETERPEIFDGLGTPAAYLIDVEGKTASQLAYGADQVPVLVRAAAGLSEKKNGSRKKSSRSKRTTKSKKTAQPGKIPASS